VLLNVFFLLLTPEGDEGRQSRPQSQRGVSPQVTAQLGPLRRSVSRAKEFVAGAPSGTGGAKGEGAGVRQPSDAGDRGTHQVKVTVSESASALRGDGTAAAGADNATPASDDAGRCVCSQI
jgi:hypothetical protein